MVIFADYVSSSQRPQNSIILNTHPNFDPSHLYAKPSTSAKHRNNNNNNNIAQQQQHLPSSIPRDDPVASTSYASDKFQLPKISSFKNSAHSSSQESNNSHSDYSGGSGVTLPLDEPIEYADA